jgi:hypothetical protein
MSGLLLRVRPSAGCNYIAFRALVEHFAAATAALQPGDGRLGLWQSARQMATVSWQKAQQGLHTRGKKRRWPLAAVPVSITGTSTRTGSDKGDGYFGASTMTI